MEVAQCPLLKPSIAAASTLVAAASCVRVVSSISFPPFASVTTKTAGCVGLFSRKVRLCFRGNSRLFSGSVIISSYEAPIASIVSGKEPDRRDSPGFAPSVLLGAPLSMWALLSERLELEESDLLRLKRALLRAQLEGGARLAGADPISYPALPPLPLPLPLASPAEISPRPAWERDRPCVALEAEETG